MDDWSSRRFFVAPNYLLDEEEILIVLTDINFWAENLEDLINWCKNNQCENKGMTVEVPDQKTLTMFVLRWS